MPRHHLLKCKNRAKRAALGIARFVGFSIKRATVSGALALQIAGTESKGIKLSIQNLQKGQVSTGAEESLLLVIIINMHQLILLRTLAQNSRFIAPEVRTVYTICNPHQQSQEWGNKCYVLALAQCAGCISR